MSAQQNQSSGHGRPWVPAHEGGPLVPPEPFAYMSNRDGAVQKIRSPLGAVLMGLVIVAGALWILEMVLSAKHPISAFGYVVSILIVAVFGALGGVFIYIGIKRWIWKRTYTRIVGHSPWEGIP